MGAQISEASKRKQAAVRLGEPYRKVGRPSKMLVIKRRYYRRKQLKKKYGCDLIAIMIKKGYIMTKREAKLAAKKEAAKVEVAAEQPYEAEVTQAPAVAKDQFAGKDADIVLKGVINALLEGKLVPGFALLPEAKAEVNHTVEQIVVKKFAPGHPAYKMSLVTIKGEYAN